MKYTFKYKHKYTITHIYVQKYTNTQTEKLYYERRVPSECLRNGANSDGEKRDPGKYSKRMNSAQP